MRRKTIMAKTDNQNPLRVLHFHDRTALRGGADLYLRDVIAHTPCTHGLVTGREPQPVSTAASFHTILPGLESLRPEPSDWSRAVDAFKPDVIHIHNIMNPTLLKQLCLQTCPTVATVHDHRSFCPGRGKWMLNREVCTRPMSQEQCGQCFTDVPYFLSILDTTQQRLARLKEVHLTVVSQYMAREFEAVKAPAFAIHPPLCNVSLRNTATVIQPPRPYVAFCGRLVESKGVWQAVEIWRRSEIDIPLLFIGTGRLRGDLERQGFEVTGWLPQGDALQRLSRARALLFPPLWQEPFGMVGPEALALGVPVVAWDSGGIREWCPDSQIRPYMDLAGMAELLRTSVSSAPPSQEDSLLSSKAFGERWLNTYESVLAGFESG